MHPNGRQNGKIIYLRIVAPRGKNSSKNEEETPAGKKRIVEK